MARRNAENDRSTMRSAADHDSAEAVLGRLFAVQTMLEGLPEEQQIFTFLAHALKDCPGVLEVGIALARSSSLSVSVADEAPGGRISGVAHETHRFTLVGHGGSFGTLSLTDDGSGRMLSFLPYIGNVVAAASMIIDNRRLVASLKEENRQLYTSLVNNIPSALFRLPPPPNDRCLFVNAEIEQITGFCSDDFLAGRLPFHGLVVAEDRRLLAIAPSLTAGEPYAIEYRIRHADGGIRWVQERGRGIHQADGTLDRIDGMLFDVTARKQTEESMRLATLVYENSNEAMSVTDADGAILTINPAFTHMTGYMAEEVLGKNPRILKSGLQDQAFYRTMWRAIDTTGHWRGEIWNRRKNGELFLAEVTINTIFNEDGVPRRRVALYSDITQKKESEEQLWKQANFDSLTGLPNRRMFRDRLEQEIKKSRRTGQSLALLFLDLDRFKEVNDTLGHEIGDVLLQEAARRLCGCVREIDSVARLGGDEFTLILCELDSPNRLERIAQHILQDLAEPFRLGEELAYASASIGITLYPDDASNVEQLLKNADQAMYAAKHQGRNRFCYFTAAMQEDAQTRRRLMSDLRQALAGHQFHVYYQPIVELASGDIHKAEALIRWRHPVRGLVAPAEFIHIAEETGLIADIGDWVFREAARQVAHWRASHDAAFQISINKSPVQFHLMHNPHYLWFDHLRELGLPGESIVIEITEGLLLDASGAIIEQLLAFRDAGLQVAIDDFGTGYSALSYLKKFHIDYLKIDQSFTQGLAPDSDSLAVCEAVIAMAHKLGLKVIAEGVETRAQRDLLAAAGCDYGQGYLFGKPAPVEEFERLLRQAVYQQ